MKSGDELVCAGPATDGRAVLLLVRFDFLPKLLVVLFLLFCGFLLLFQNRG